VVLIVVIIYQSHKVYPNTFRLILCHRLLVFFIHPHIHSPTHSFLTKPLTLEQGTLQCHVKFTIDRFECWFEVLGAEYDKVRTWLKTGSKTDHDSITNPIITSTPPSSDYLGQRQFNAICRGIDTNSKNIIQRNNSNILLMTAIKTDNIFKIYLPQDLTHSEEISVLETNYNGKQAYLYDNDLKDSCHVHFDNFANHESAIRVGISLIEKQILFFNSKPRWNEQVGAHVIHFNNKRIREISEMNFIFHDQYKNTTLQLGKGTDDQIILGKLINEM
jgi:hypothetical protein